MSANPKLVAVSEMSKSAGLITWWRLSGSVSIDEMAKHWEGDPSELPGLISDQVAFHRAMKHFEKGSSHFIERLPAQKDVLTGFAVVQVDHKKGTDGEPLDPEYHTLFKAWLTRESILKCTDPAHKKEIWSRFTQATAVLESSDLSAWMISMADSLHAVRLREGGGVYFVPETRVVRWKQVAKAIELSSQSTVYEVPAVKSDKAVEAILDAVMQEATQSVNAISKTLDEGELGKRALNTRLKTCSEMLDKVRHYEALLGKSLDGISSTISNLKSRIVEATLVSD